MNITDIYKKIEKLRCFVKSESDKQFSNHNCETRLWEKGYRSAMIAVKNFIDHLFHKDV